MRGTPKLILILIVLLCPAQSWGQQRSLEPATVVTGDFLVSPANKELIIKPGETASFVLSVTNRTGVGATFAIGAEDLVSAGYSDTVIADEGGLAPLPSLAEFIEAPTAIFTIAHGETMELPIWISLPSYISDLGLYALLTITTGRLDEAGVAAPRAKVLSRVGVPVLVRTNDSRVGKGELVSFGTADGSKFFGANMIEFKLSYANTGDVHIRPLGKLTLRNMFGQVSAQLPIEPWYILPGTTRSRVVALPVGVHFGPYSAAISMDDGRGELGDDERVELWILPWKSVAVIVGVLICSYLTVRRLRRRARTLEAGHE